MKKITILTLLISILFTSCVVTNQATLLPKTTSTQVAQSTRPMVPTQTTGRVTNPSPSFTQTLQNTCKMPSDMSEGKIAYYKSNIGLYFYNLTNEEKYLIPNSADSFSSLVESSPDHKRIAFFDLTGETGRVISADGNEIEVDIRGKINGIFYGWLDNSRIIFVDRSHSDGSVATLDVDTGKINNLVTGLQDLFSLGPNRWYAGGDQPTAIFDSTLNRVIYLSGELPGEALGKWGFVMRELNTQKILWSKISNDLGVQPKWSFDNTRAAILITNENGEDDKIYIVDNNGQEFQEIDTETTGVDLMEWSPDGTKVSYSGSNVLGVYDFNLGKLQKYQLQEQTETIIWSPAGNQLAIKGFLVNILSDCLTALESDNQFGPIAWLLVP